MVPPHASPVSHGLCCLGRTLAEALCLAEELEHLAALQILATV